MPVAGPAGAARSPWPPILVVASAVALGLAAMLWATDSGRVTVPLTTVELAATLTALGSFVLWRRPRHRIGPLIAVTGVAFALVTLAAAALDHLASGSGGVPPAAGQAALAAGWLGCALPVPWLLLLLWFPDGQFTRVAWRRTFVALSVVSVVVALAGYLFGPPGRLPSMLSGVSVAPGLAGPFGGPGRRGLLVAADLVSALPVVGLPAIVARYRRGDALVRQQIRWLVAAAMVTIAATLVAVGLGHGPAGAAAASTVLAAVAQPLPAVAIAVAVLRYRLWEIDVVISRAVVYAVLWAVLSVLLLVPALISGYLVGGPGTVAAVVAALVVTLAFQPVRRRLQQIVDDRVYGARRRGRMQLALAGDALRTVGDVDAVAPRLAGIVQESLDVTWATVLLHVRGDGGASWLRPVGAVGIEPPPARLSAEIVTDLVGDGHPRLGDGVPAGLVQLLPDPPAVVAPMVVAGELVGLIACGPRNREPLDDRDVEAMRRFAGECALGLRGLRLDAELRQRLAEIERQAAELRSSRQRLVRAQDDERRKLERNLHDGVQQQLVNLATRIRRAAMATDGAVREEWDGIAAAAEDAVFALQDLARGIFPVVLVDQGLAAALRTNAARSVLPVRVDIEPSISGRRFGPEVEAALCFVALEALTNVAKHAPDATASLSLRLSDSGRELVLEVHDDGPGLPPARGRTGVGLVNMNDRVAAVGGSLVIDSRQAAGTWVRAVVPLESEVVALHPADVDSRR